MQVQSIELGSNSQQPNDEFVGVEESVLYRVYSEQDDESVYWYGKKLERRSDSPHDCDDEQQGEGHDEEDVIDYFDCLAEPWVLSEKLGVEIDFVLDWVGLVSSEEEEDVGDDGDDE